jgi:hypothetical protein
MTGWWTTLLVGLAVLLFGRRLFWLLVGAIGFLVGLHVARAAFADGSEWLILAAALVLGIIGALLAVLFQWLAVGLSGFAAGVQGGLVAAGALGLGPESPWRWAVALLAGIGAAALVLWLWDPVLILLSATTGAALLTPLVPVGPGARPWIFLGLLVIGIVAQASVLAPPESPRPPGGRGT